MFFPGTSNTRRGRHYNTLRSEWKSVIESIQFADGVTVVTDYRIINSRVEEQMADTRALTPEFLVSMESRPDGEIVNILQFFTLNIPAAWNTVGKSHTTDRRTDGTVHCAEYGFLSDGLSGNLEGQEIIRLALCRSGEESFELKAENSFLLRRITLEGADYSLYAVLPSYPDEILDETTDNGYSLREMTACLKRIYLTANYFDPVLEERSQEEFPLSPS